MRSSQYLFEIRLWYQVNMFGTTICNGTAFPTRREQVGSVVRSASCMEQDEYIPLGMLPVICGTICRKNTNLHKHTYWYVFFDIREGEGI